MVPGLVSRDASRVQWVGGSISCSLMNCRSTSVKDPVSRALMSGLSRGADRWPSWVCACVSGTNLAGVLGAHIFFRCRLNCFDHSLSHHAGLRLPLDYSGSRPTPTILRRNVTPRLPQRPRCVPSPGRLLCASSTPSLAFQPIEVDQLEPLPASPRRCAPFCWPAPPSPA